MHLAVDSQKKTVCNKLKSTHILITNGCENLLNSFSYPNAHISFLYMVLVPFGGVLYGSNKH